MGVKKVAKTAVGIFAGSVAIDAFKADSKAKDLKEKLVLKGIGSIAASTSFHILKDDIIETVDGLRLGASPKRLLLKEK
jgi:hypothetical protein